LGCLFSAFCSVVFFTVAPDQGPIPEPDVPGKLIFFMSYE